MKGRTCISGGINNCGGTVPLRRQPHGRLSQRWKVNVKTDIKEVGDESDLYGSGLWLVSSGTNNVGAWVLSQDSCHYHPLYGLDYLFCCSSKCNS
jgi:hypothetical protein